jgi:hypothetical protein
MIIGCFSVTSVVEMGAQFAVPFAVEVNTFMESDTKEVIEVHKRLFKGVINQLLCL